MKTSSLCYLLILRIILNCVSTSEVVYDYNLESEETAEFTDCEDSEKLEYWESYTIHTKICDELTLVVYVAHIESKKVLWHVSIICDLNQPAKKLKL